MKFDENLRELRKEKGYSQEELADRLNVTRQTVSKWENGSAMPDLKKLTELAEFFGVSMDTLLGLHVDSAGTTQSDNSAFEAYVQYTNQRIASLEESHNQEANKKIKTLSVVFVIVLFILIIWLINFSGKISLIRNELNILDYSIQYLQSLQNQMHYSGSSDDNNYWESKVNDVTVSFLSVDPDKPYIVEAQLKYSPTSYTKGSKVYFSVPKEDKSIEKLEATEENGEFVLTTNIDITIDGAFYFILEDGDEIVKEELYIDPINLYCEFESRGGLIYYRIEKPGTIMGMDSDYYLENAFHEYDLTWSGIAADELVSAEFVVENNGEEVFAEKLDFKKSDDTNKYLIKLDDYSLTLTDPIELKIYIRVTDRLGVIYKHYAELDAPYTDSEDISYYGSYNALIFDVEGKGAVEVNFYKY